MKTGYIFSGFVCVLFVGYYIFSQIYSCDHLECKLTTPMYYLGKVQTEIEVSIRDNSMIVLSTEFKENVENGTVSDDGKVSFRVDKYTITAAPLYKDNQWSWVCDVSPKVDREIGLLKDCGRLFK